MADSNRLLPLRILQILKKHSDAEHPLSQKEIQTLLDQEYGMRPERGAIRRCIHELMQAEDVPIEGIEREYAYRNSATKEKETGSQYTGLYYRHDFDPSELHMLLDGVLFSKNIPAGQRKDLLDRISSLGGKYFRSYMSRLHGTMPNMPEIPQLFLNIELLNEAIRTKKQIRLEYGYLGTDFSLHPAWARKNGEPYWMIINPYRLAALDGRYFLICNNDKYDTLSIFRVDRIIRAEILDTPAKPQRDIHAPEKSSNTAEFIQRNAFMGFGESGTVVFRIRRNRAYEAIDFFGKAISFKEDRKDPGYLLCTVDSNYYSMKLWALQNAELVKVLSPEALVTEIREALEAGLAIYAESRPAFI